jgi:hypothetical protein
MLSHCDILLLNTGLIIGVVVMKATGVAVGPRDTLKIVERMEFAIVSIKYKPCPPYMRLKSDVITKKETPWNAELLQRS